MIVAMEADTLLVFLFQLLSLTFVLWKGDASGAVYDKCERQGVHITEVEKGIIRSERYPSMYPPNRFCKWHIQVKSSQTLRITVLDVDLDDTQGKDHCKEYVSIFNPYSRENHATECGRIDEPKLIEVENNTVEIWFQSSLNKTQDKRGFMLEFEAVGCDDISTIEGATVERNGNVTRVTCNDGDSKVQDIFCIGTTWHPAPHPIICKGLPIHSKCQSEPVNIVDTEGYIHSPNFPYEYPPDKLCVWRLGDQTRRRLRITIHKLNLTPTDYPTECRDYLGIYELTRGDPVTDIHCQTLEDALAVVVESGLVDILFESRERPDDKLPGHGFLIKYKAIGCAKIITPSGARMESSENETRITCSDGRQFNLTCVDREWSPPSSSISCWPVSESTIPITTVTTTQVEITSTGQEGLTSSITSIIAATSDHIPVQDDEHTNESDGSFPLLPVIIGVVAAFIFIILAIIIFLICRRRKLKSREGPEDDTLKINDPDNQDCETEPRTETDIGMENGNAVTSNGHVVAQVHYVRPTKRSLKKNKDSMRSKRTSYHLTVADDETAMIDNDNCAVQDNT